jgi:PAS domain-containing protein
VLPDDACIAKDSQGRIERWSPAAEALFGYAAEPWGRARSCCCRNRIGTNPSGLPTGWRRANILHLYTRRRHKSGHLLPVSLTARARRGADGQLAGIDKRYRRLGDECAIVRQLTLEAGDFARLFARTPMPMCITRMTDGTVLAINTSFQSFMGRTEEACWATARWTWACGDRPASAARCWSGCTGKDACTTPAGRAARWAGRPAATRCWPTSSR